MAEKERNAQNEARSVVKYLRISPRKVRLVLNGIRRKPASWALSRLPYLNKKAARIVEAALKSAVANAKVKGLDEKRLMVSEVRADGGPVMKRFMSRSMGRADRIIKRTTHLTVVLREEAKTFGPPPQASAGQEEKKGKFKKPKAAKAGAKA